ncbi:hypothetical protein A4A49_62809, partial [Nicotiana attenuata]
MIPTLGETILPQALYQPPHLLTHLELSLPQEGTQYNDHLMKIMIWNCRGENGLEFLRNLQFLLQWNNPSILCLIEIKMQDHTSLLQEFDFTDLIQVAAYGHSSGIVLLWRPHELTVDHVAVTSQEIHASVQVS